MILSDCVHSKMVVFKMLTIMALSFKTSAAIETGFFAIGIFSMCSDDLAARQTEQNRDAQEFSKVLKLIHEATVWGSLHSGSYDIGDSFDPGDDSLGTEDDSMNSDFSSTGDSLSTGNSTATGESLETDSETQNSTESGSGDIEWGSGDFSGNETLNRGKYTSFQTFDVFYDHKKLVSVLLDIILDQKYNFQNPKKSNVNNLRIFVVYTHLPSNMLSTVLDVLSYLRITVRYLEIKQQPDGTLTSSNLDYYVEDLTRVVHRFNWEDLFLISITNKSFQLKR